MPNYQTIGRASEFGDALISDYVMKPAPRRMSSTSASTRSGTSSRPIIATKREGNCQQAEISFEPVLHIEVVHPRQLYADWGLTDIEIVGHDGSEGCHSTLKVSKPCACAAISGDLLVVVAGDADGELLREMLEQRKLNVEFGAGFVIRRRMTPITSQAGSAQSPSCSSCPRSSRRRHSPKRDRCCSRQSTSANGTKRTCCLAT